MNDSTIPIANGCSRQILPPVTMGFSTYLSALIVLYVFFVRMQRYKRVQMSEREFAKISKLTPAQAQRLMQVPALLDFPWIVSKAWVMALVKTYGIPTVSHLLHTTKQLGKKETSSKRLVDTLLLFMTWITCPISGPGSGAPSPVGNSAVDPRSAIAVSRMNLLHGHYPSISNDDFLYTLFLLIYEPIKWAERFEWRGFSDAECKASYVFWAEIGRRMGITDIPSTFEELREWGEAYERDYMVPDEINAIVGDQTIALSLHKVPNALKPFGRKVVICLFEERLRKAMLLPEPSPLLTKVVHGILYTRAFFIRNFCLPRTKLAYLVDLHPTFTPGRVKTDPPRVHPQYYENYPWYYPESTGLWKLFERTQILMGLARAEDFAGPHFQSTGYRLEELGPKAFANSDHERIMRMAEQMQGAPVTGPFSLNYASACPMLG